MRATTTAVALAIAASLAAGDDSGKSGKSGSKSSKSGDCTDCSADTLTRANLVTSLFFSNWSVDGELNPASTQAWCDADGATQDAFIKAVDNTAGQIFKGQYLVDAFFSALVNPEVTDPNQGELQSNLIDVLCSIEQEGITCDFVDEIPDNPCDVLNDNTRALEADQSGQPSDMKSYFKSLFN